MKRIKKFLLLLSLPVLAACTFVPNTSEDNSMTSEESSSETITDETSYVDPVGDHFYRPQSLRMHLNEVFETQETEILGSLGTQKMLVIPVDFKDYSCSNLDAGCAGAKENIRKAFFGTTAETGWESVSSYYYKSSYGKLNLTGEVSDWFTLDVTRAGLQNKLTDNYQPTWYVLEEAVEWYKEQTSSNLKEFDLDNDGYLDAVWLVYACNEDDPAGNAANGDDEDNIYWAYTYWNYYAASNKNSPNGNCYAWASYNFLNEGGYSTPTDAHTLIHETGHVLGLDDYYRYWSSYSYLGGVDMMDHNVGDHNAYSKMLLEWTTPFVVTDSGDLTIRPFESSGDAILVRDSSWNGSAFDEYFLIEYYTPTGLNAKDITGYANGTKTYSIPGIKVYHVDSRLAKATWGDAGYSFPSNPYVDDIYSSGQYFSAVAASNTPNYSINPNYRLIELITSAGNKYSSTSYSKNGDLFQVGDSFKTAPLDAFNFNDSTKLGFGFTVKSFDSNSATITFIKK